MRPELGVGWEREAGEFGIECERRVVFAGESIAEGGAIVVGAQVEFERASRGVAEGERDLIGAVGALTTFAVQQRVAFLNQLRFASGGQAQSLREILPAQLQAERRIGDDRGAAALGTMLDAIIKFCPGGKILLPVEFGELHRDLYGTIGRGDRPGLWSGVRHQRESEASR